MFTVVDLWYVQAHERLTKGCAECRLPAFEGEGIET